MKLTLEHLSCYLPYDLKWSLQELKQFTMTGITQETLYTKEGVVLRWTKHPNLPQALFPILRPLSDLTKEIEHNGEKFVPYVKLCWGNGTQVIPLIENGKINYSEMKKLYEWHFDVFGLIEKGLAININDL